MRSVHGRFGDPVYEDSCVEIFLEPRPGRGYLNFEMNAGGALLASHVTDSRRVGGALAGSTRLSEAEGQQRAGALLAAGASSSRSSATPVEWQLAFFIPLAVLERYLGALGPLGGQSWRANLYKCGDKTSHPHWASWAPLDGAQLPPARSASARSTSRRGRRPTSVRVESADAPNREAPLALLLAVAASFAACGQRRFAAEAPGQAGRGLGQEDAREDDARREGRPARGARA